MTKEEIEKLISVLKELKPEPKSGLNGVKSLQIIDRSTHFIKKDIIIEMQDGTKIEAKNITDFKIIDPPTVKNYYFGD